MLAQQPQYGDAWDESAYLQFLYDRLPLLRDLLADDGSLWLHCDHRHTHHLRCLLEEVFGAKNYLNTITWRSQTPRGAKVNAFYFANSAHTIHVFAKDRSARRPAGTPAKKTLVLSEAQAAAEFMRDERGFFRTSDPGTYSFESLQRLHAEGPALCALWRRGGAGRRQPAAPGAATAATSASSTTSTDLGDGRHAVERGVDNIWDDIPGLGTTPGEDLGYPTQKTEALLDRILADRHAARRLGARPLWARARRWPWRRSWAGAGWAATSAAAPSRPPAAASRPSSRRRQPPSGKTRPSRKPALGAEGGGQAGFHVYTAAPENAPSPLQVELAIAPNRRRSD